MIAIDMLPWSYYNLEIWRAKLLQMPVDSEDDALVSPGVAAAGNVDVSSLACSLMELVIR